ncbi:purine-nucleoside phosphorylase [Candidatus Woesearchaeota archaeon]|nr:purine-nucleoside phosphorylase [Candidatus Woesearchaeota archaeon]
MNLEQAFDFQKNYERKVAEAADYLRPFLAEQPHFGIVLGSGLGDLASRIEQSVVLPYSSIPNFPVPTIEGHEGKLHIGKLQGVPVIGLQGRKHFYEVADLAMNVGMLQVVFPVHVLAELCVPNYFVTNAAGGLNLDYQVGDMMILRSHINMIPSPLLGQHHSFKRVNDGQRVWRFQPMSFEYDPSLRSLLEQSGEQFGQTIRKGVYLAVTGPTYETQGECIAFRDGLHADAVGMSTTPEVIIARNRGMNCVGFSCITNKIAADGTNATNHEEVKAILDSAQVRHRLTSTVENFFRAYSRNIRKQ